MAFQIVASLLRVGGGDTAQGSPRLVSPLHKACAMKNC